MLVAPVSREAAGRGQDTGGHVALGDLVAGQTSPPLLHCATVWVEGYLQGAGKSEPVQEMVDKIRRTLSASQTCSEYFESSGCLPQHNITWEEIELSLSFP